MKDIYDHLFFKLKSEAADFEFEMIAVPPYDFLEKNLSMEPYEYFGEINEIFGFRTHQVMLYYNADILMRVVIKFKGNLLKEIREVIEKQNVSLPPIMFLKMYFENNGNLTVLTYQNKILN